MKQNYYSHFVDENIETERSACMEYVADNSTSIWTHFGLILSTLLWNLSTNSPALPSFWPMILSLHGWISTMLYHIKIEVYSSMNNWNVWNLQMVSV